MDKLQFERDWERLCENAFQSRQSCIPPDITLDYAVCLIDIDGKSRAVTAGQSDETKEHMRDLENAYHQLLELVRNGYYRFGFREGVKMALEIL